MTTLELVTLIVAVLLNASRLLKSAEPLWSFLPAKFRWIPSLAVALIPQAVSLLGGVKTSLDLVNVGVMLAALVVPGAMSAAHAQLESQQ